MFRVGDRVKIVPTRRVDWNSEGRMEASVGMVGEIVGYSRDGGFDVEFFTCKCDTNGHRTLWTYDPADMKKFSSFKGNK